MTTRRVLETVFRKLNKYEIVRVDSTFTTEFWIYKNGKAYRGKFSCLADAVNAAKKERF